MDEIEEQQKQELINRQVDVTGNKDSTVNAGDSMKLAELLGSKFKLVNSMGSTSIDDWSQLYNWSSLNIRRRGFFIGDDTGAKTGTWGYPKIKSEVLTTMQKLLGDQMLIANVPKLIYMTNIPATGTVENLGLTIYHWVKQTEYKRKSKYGDKGDPKYVSHAMRLLPKFARQPFIEKEREKRVLR